MSFDWKSWEILARSVSCLRDLRCLGRANNDDHEDVHRQHCQNDYDRSRDRYCDGKSKSKRTLGSSRTHAFFRYLFSDWPALSVNCISKQVTADISVSQTTTTNTITSTSTPTTVSVTSTTTVSVSTSTTVTTTQTSTTTSTNTVVAPTPTVYGACASNNVIGSANGNVGIYDVSYASYAGVQISQQSITDSVDCCAACQTTANCVGFAQYPTGPCYLFATPGQCDGSAVPGGDNFQTSSAVGAGQGYVVGNGNCGQFSDGGSV